MSNVKPSEARREYCRQWRLRKLAEDPDYEKRKKKAAYIKKHSMPKLPPDEAALKRREYQKEWRKKNPYYHKEWTYKNYGGGE